MPAPLSFLVVDDNRDSRFLLVKTLLRKFPASVIHECHAADTALKRCRSERFSAVVTHRTTEMPGLALTRALREANDKVPLVMVSSIDRREAALGAGASAFLLYDEWLRIGTIVEQLINRRTLSSAKTDRSALEPSRETANE